MRKIFRSRFQYVHIVSRMCGDCGGRQATSRKEVEQKPLFIDDL